MNELSDQELLAQYRRDASESAFKELVRRHTDLVYSTALRLLVDTHLAEDVSQRVFVTLAQNARKLADRVTLGGWLHLTTRNFAVMTIRTEERRRLREQKAAPMISDTTDNNDAAWESVAPHLDEALSELNDTDRDLVVLRFLERKTAREVGQRFGLSEEAAQKRTTRALERLRKAVRSRGVAVSSVALGGIISAQAVQAAPSGLAGALAVKALAVKVAAPTLAGLLLKPIVYMAQFKSHPVAAVASLVACLSLGTGGFYVGHGAAARHWTAVAWQKALNQSPASNTQAETIASDAGTARDAGDSTNAVAARQADNTQGRSVSEILTLAAQYFRSSDTDPDAYAKGAAEVLKLRLEDASEALRVLETFRGDKTVFNAMAPQVVKLWAQTEPRAALEYALTRLDAHPRGMAIELLSPVWARQEPEATWAWYRQTTESGKLPSEEGNWLWLPTTVFKAWAANDAAGAVAQLGTLSATEESRAIGGIADAAALSQYRPAILEAMAGMKDDEQRGRLAVAMAKQWSKVDPESAANWASTLQFQNPAARLHASAEAFESWWNLDPHAAAVWMLTQAPGELLDQFKQLVAPAQLEKLHNAAR